MAEEPSVTRIGEGVYRVEQAGRADIVYVAGRADDWWAFWNGQVFRGPGPVQGGGRRAHGAGARQSLTAPMPATVIRVLVEPGAVVRKGDTVVVLEAMKMELPVRAEHAGTVAAVRCREGDIVQADAVLIDFQP